LPLHVGDWLLVIGVALGLLAVVEIGKAFTNRRHRSAPLQMSRNSRRMSRGA
jgi:hypothetical protein